MPKDAAPKEEHRSFTVRVPESFYNELGDLANSEGIFVNVLVNRLLRLGLNKHVSVETALARLLKKEMIAA